MDIKSRNVVIYKRQSSIPPADCAPNPLQLQLSNGASMDVTTQQVMGSPLVHDPQTQRPFTTPFRNLFPPPPSVWLSSYVRVTVPSSENMQSLRILALVNASQNVLSLEFLFQPCADLPQGPIKRFAYSKPKSNTLHTLRTATLASRLMKPQNVP